MPPRAPKVRARLPATVPSIAQNIAVASSVRGSSSHMRGLVICAGMNGAAGAADKFDEPGAGQDPFGRHVVVTLAHEIEDGALARIGRRHRHVPALARDGHRAALSWNQRAHAEPGARPYE